MAIVQREFTQPMKYFLTAACLKLGCVHVPINFELVSSKFQNPSHQEGAERVVNGVRPYLEANLQAIQDDPAACMPVYMCKAWVSRCSKWVQFFIRLVALCGMLQRAPKPPARWGW